MTHAQQRCLQRYGIWLTGPDFNEMRRQVRDGDCVKVSRVSKKIGVYILTVQSRSVMFVYNKQTKFFITALTIPKGDFVIIRKPEEPE